MSGSLHRLVVHLVVGIIGFIAIMVFVKYFFRNSIIVINMLTDNMKLMAILVD